MECESEEKQEKTTEEMEAEEDAEQARIQNMSEQEIAREQEMKKRALSQIVGAETSSNSWINSSKMIGLGVLRRFQETFTEWLPSSHFLRVHSLL